MNLTISSMAEDKELTPRPNQEASSSEARPRTSVRTRRVPAASTDGEHTTAQPLSTRRRRVFIVSEEDQASRPSRPSSHATRVDNPSYGQSSYPSYQRHSQTSPERSNAIRANEQTGAIATIITAPSDHDVGQTPMLLERHIPMGSLSVQSRVLRRVRGSQRSQRTILYLSQSSMKRS